MRITGRWNNPSASLDLQKIQIEGLGQVLKEFQAIEAKWSKALFARNSAYTYELNPMLYRTSVKRSTLSAYLYELLARHYFRKMLDVSMKLPKLMG